METSKKQHIFGLDIHPTCFTAAKFNEDCPNAREAKALIIQHNLPMERFEKWLLKHTCEGDTLVMESLNMSFQLVKKIKGHNRCAIILENHNVGKLGKSYLKNDKVDAIKIAKVFLSGFDDRVWVPDEKTLERREVFFAYKRAVKDCTRHQCRLWGYLTSQGIVVSKKIKTNYKKDFNYIFTLRDWTRNQKNILQLLKEDLELAIKKRSIFESIMAEEVSSDSDMLTLQQFYGIRLVSPYALMAIIGDIKRFRTPKKLVAYIGLQPKVKDSGDSSHTGSISRHGRQDLKAILTECAKSIIHHAPSDNELVKWAMKLRYRKSANVVAIAVARKLVTAIWYVLNGYSSQLLEINKMMKTKLRKLASHIGLERRNELGFKNINHFIEQKSKLLLEYG
jgi:transposase